jgi:uncharacterized membrane protein YkvI
MSVGDDMEPQNRQFREAIYHLYMEWLKLIDRQLVVMVMVMVMVMKSSACFELFEEWGMTRYLGECRNTAIHFNLSYITNTISM